MNTTYDVRVWGIREHKGKDRKTGKPRNSFRARWRVEARPFGETFQTRPLAESFRAKLLTAQREGIAFDTASGLPEPMARKLNSKSWYEHAVEFVDMKWPRAAASHRRSIAETLANVTPALLASTHGSPSDAEIQRALYAWSFNKTRREGGSPPAELAPTVRWLEAHTMKLTDLNNAEVIRKALDTLSLRQDGRAAAATTVARKRGVFYSALRYAVELRRLPSHPMEHVQWIAPRSEDEVDRRSVINPAQALQLLTAVSRQAPRLVAFFACMYYAAMRPAEVVHLRIDDCKLPDSGWGLLRLTGSTQHAGLDWGDDPGVILEDRELKHRAKTATRPVPAPPILVRALRWHVACYGTAPDGRLFSSSTYGRRPISKWAYAYAWRHARRATFTEAQQRSPLAARPYDLRHAAVSLWLNAGVPATQVAEWAGHSVNVLLKVYAKCIEGQDEAARRRIEHALGANELDT
ncbi:tyrosine-type recombinase/integrase [Couchioplanes caeruleus]|uniref:Integrase n=2 Tax=Couchioplanes caeruleus TaxID=56438 RepID=A0A1K0GGQ9_9ACTN|nr:tyrosine-type recombinase/integrase [Couchioplanes caeruleus]OJF10052.1 integrase [Couchioplanes caeruleus subsp. caeruleus]ROP27663.1 phage integrase family protein [Couchioplanes caeruleus]